MQMWGVKSREREIDKKRRKAREQEADQTEPTGCR